MDSQKDLKQLGQKFKEAREKKKMTQVEVAKKAGMNTNYYAVIERGEINPSFETLKKIAEALSIKSLTF
jgi:transcriptional regulator with XRE-family HTH domain